MRWLEAVYRPEAVADLQEILRCDKVVITNVFHGGRDFEAIYRGRDPEPGPL